MINASRWDGDICEFVERYRHECATQLGGGGRGASPNVALARRAEPQSRRDDDEAWRDLVRDESGTHAILTAQRGGFGEDRDEPHDDRRSRREGMGAGTRICRRCVEIRTAVAAAVVGAVAAYWKADELRFWVNCAIAAGTAVVVRFA